jgi:hypothetical protein
MNEQSAAALKSHLPKRRGNGSRAPVEFGISPCCFAGVIHQESSSGIVRPLAGMQSQRIDNRLEATIEFHSRRGAHCGTLLMDDFRELRNSGRIRQQRRSRAVKPGPICSPQYNAHYAP